ncbi:MAG: HTH domain-containing protein [bacterium]
MAQLEKGASVKNGVLYNPKEIVRVILSHLSERDADIITRRHGLLKDKKETLEEIGKSYKLTRERIRQIESAVVARLKNINAVMDTVEDVAKHVQSVMGRHGWIMEEKHFLDELHLPEITKDPLAKRASLFLASELLTNHMEPVSENDKTRKGWKHKQAAWELFEQTVIEAKRIMENHKEPMTMDKLLDQFHKGEFYKSNTESLADDHIKAYLNLSQELHYNAFNEWGMTDWPSVSPRRMADKIYLVLKKHGQPLHFREITSKINEVGFNGKQAYAATVHNELILDDRFVLVGRGLYALKEWGYKTGTVADVIADALKRAGKPLTKDELTTEVLKQRLVKPATINLALMNKKRFKKAGPKLYTVI